MRIKTLAAIVALALGMATLASLLTAFPLWLPSAQRNNPNDPLSPNYSAKATSPTETNTPANTPTPPNTPTLPGTATYTPTFTPTFTATPTPLTWYTGKTPYALANLSVQVESPAVGGFTENSTGGPSNGAYLAITTSAANGTWNFNAVLSLNAGPLNVSAGADAISLWVRDPSLSCGSAIDFRPCVSLRNPNFGYPNDRSVPVTCTAYACLSCLSTSPLFQFTELGESNWVNVIIPLSAFLGANSQGGSFTAADLTQVSAVCLAPWWGDWNSNGAMPATEVDVADITFPSLGTAPGNQGANAVGKTIDDFEVSGATQIGQAGWEYDQDTINPITCPTQYTTPTSAVFPICGNTPVAGNPSEAGGYTCSPVDAGGNTLSCSHSGYMSGVQNGSTNNGCTGGNYPLVRMMTDFSDTYPAGVSLPAASAACPSPATGSLHYIEVTDNHMITALPSIGASGLRFRCKTGASTGQLYTVQILRLSTSCNWANWQICIADSSLTPGQWTTIQADFPADGTAPPDNEGSAEDLVWGMPTSWATPEPWSRSDFCKIIVRAMVGGAFNFSIDDIEFY